MEGKYASEIIIYINAYTDRSMLFEGLRGKRRIGTVGGCY